MPGVFSTCVYDGKVSLCNLLACTSSGASVETVNADFSVSTTISGTDYSNCDLKTIACAADTWKLSDVVWCLANV